MKRQLILIVASALTAAAASGQVNLNAGACQSLPGGKTKVLVFAPVLFGTVTVSVPLCAVLGPGFSVDLTAAPPTINYTAPAVAPPVIPHMVVDTVVFAPTLPASQLVLPYTLSHTPAPGTLLLAVFRSSMLGWGTVDIQPFNATTPKAITITLPLYRPFPDDGVQVQYWTLEP